MGENRFDIEPRIAGSAADGVVTIGVAASVDLHLAGLRLGADGVGIGARISFTADGRPGLTVELDGPQPPRRVTAALTLPGASGGGTLEQAGGRWRMALLASLGVVTVTAAGVLDTDRPPGLILLLGGEINPPIPLPFGLLLIGVGGVIGINRAPDRDQVSAAVSSGDLSRLLFPHDPAAEADRLLPVLERCFPRRPGSFVVGPMVKVGWGPQNMVSATIGVLIADDSVTVVGRVVVNLPSPALPLICLQALVVGRVDAGGLAVDASLHGSRILFIGIEGDLRLRLRTGPDALFALSVGGFHPAFPPPAGMAGMRRVAMRLDLGSLVELRLEAYLAVTTGSVQFGARVDLGVELAIFSLRGHLAFDALFVFTPYFRFEVSFEASVSVRVAGMSFASIELSGRLCGPAPWRITGHASISVLFFSISIDLPEIVWGEKPDTPLPGAPDPVAVLSAQLRRADAWEATSRDVPSLARLRPHAATAGGGDPDAATAGVHPLARLGFRQHAVPLEQALSRMDGIPLGTPVTLRIRTDRDQPIAATGTAPFVPQQFFERGSEAQLSTTGYDHLPGGFDLTVDEHRLGEFAARDDEDCESVVIKGSQASPVTRVRIAEAFVAAPAVRVAAPLLQLRSPAELRVTSRNRLADLTGDAVALPAGAAYAAFEASAAAGDLQLVNAWELT
ncbi:DUF6603 domain-containing protein [Actinoplanes sp. DH11]|uniref:DUF6603 domain-containing protein n=1 Tax=Actinoplanes sp. DH11 TaxID=2857011 RepID=UPI001E2E7421|nr:DUF6603 domain-containing protein [Actinoplanes sp. DH11]